MPKGYWIARIDVHNPDGYKDYVAQNGAVFKKYGGKFLVAPAGMFKPRKARAFPQRRDRIQGLRDRARLL